MPARTGSEVKTIGHAWREFRAKRAPWLIAAAIVLALAARIALGDLTWRDLVAAAFLAVVYPFGEWAIHVHLLHLKPFRWRGRRVELPTAAAHRPHHEAPPQASRGAAAVGSHHLPPARARGDPVRCRARRGRPARAVPAARPADH